ncbi:MAG: hypothetical protein ACRDSH_01680, partial [Pseudonocardiaceae bacterium]
MFGNRGSAGAAFAVLTTVVMVSVAPSAVADTAPGGQARRVGLLTGAGSLNVTEGRYDIKGTDLGIMWT